MTNFTQYQKISQRTAGHLNGGDPRLNLGISTLGLVGESGEVSEIIKKHLGHGHEINIDKVTKELGDVLWYISDIAAQLGISLEDIAAKNIEKLKARYPEGFSHEDSLGRSE
jgi:NTP pyrophosphatase (non-canonical NTP hydrolase)